MSKQEYYQGSNQGRRSKNKYDKPTNYNYLNVWKANPSYKEIHIHLAIAKMIWIVAVLLIIDISLLSLNINLITIIGITILICSFFIIAFKDEFFILNNRFWFRKMLSFDPFIKTKFLLTKNDPHTVYIINRKDVTITGLRIFEIVVIPPNIKAALNTFIRTLNNSDISYTYQVIQKPTINLSNDRQCYPGNNIHIYFCFYISSKGIVTNSKITGISEKLDVYAGLFSTNFKANFNHFKTHLLTEGGLIDALTIFVTKNKADNTLKENQTFEQVDSSSGLTLKLIFCCFLLLFVSWFLFNLRFSFLLVALSNLAIFFSLALIWWREVLYAFTKINLMKISEVKEINPFSKFAFLKLKKYPSSLFIHIDNKLLISSKQFNLKHAAPPVVDRGGNFLIKPNKFLRAMVEDNYSFSYNLNLTPIDFPSLNKKSTIKHFKPKFEREVLKANTEQKGRNWMNIRAGVWQTIFTLEISSHAFTEDLNANLVEKLEKKLKINSEVMVKFFHDNCPEYFFIPLKNNKLLSGYKLLALKNTHFRLNGSHLNYLLFMGTTIMNLSVIAGEFRRGVESRIAAEFNTPLELDNNFVTFGHTINTESLEKEIPAGFTLEQVKNLLITNGSTANREELAMKLVSELNLKQIPSIVFDFRGNWSKLIKIPSITHSEKNSLHFKLGTTFSVNPLYSEIPYDENKTEYIDYIIDAYAMAFKQDKRETRALKDTLINNLEKDLDISSVILELQNQRDWEKNPYSPSIVSIFKEFNEQSAIFSRQFDNSEILSFIKNNKTVILDLSILKDIEQKLFITFVIISKFIHYAKNHEDFTEKVIVIPHVDLFYDNWYIDKQVNYGKISNFLDPLLNNDFGVVLMASQIHYLHPNLFSHITNLITFKASDTRDIAILKNQMNFQELHGVGIYSSSRNESYQIDFLKGLKKDELLVKRYDFNHPFPAKMDVKEIRKTAPLNYEEIVIYMNDQGYDLKSTEKKLLAQARKTIFERDLGKYFIFTEEIINFLKNVKEVEMLPLYNVKLREELKQYIYPKALKLYSRDKKRIVKIRNELYEILKRHGYLVENHPKTPSGSQSIRTAYSVGPKFNKAVNDYFQNAQGGEFKEDFKPIIISSEQKLDLKKDFDPEYKIKVEKKTQFKEILAKTIGEHLISDLSTMRNCIDDGDFKKALFLQRDFVREFLVTLYSKKLGVDEKLASSDKHVLEAINYLFENFDLPFTSQEVENLINLSKIKNLTGKDFETKIKENYNSCLNFFYKLKKTALEW